MKFSYKRFLVQPLPREKPSFVYRPVIPIHIEFGKQRIAYEALVDSGADYSIFHAQIGEAVGLNVRAGQRIIFTGVSGTPQEGFRNQVKLVVGRWRFPCDVVFAYGLKIPYGILGQAELFERFTVTFDRQAGWLDLKPRRSSQ